MTEPPRGAPPTATPVEPAVPLPPEPQLRIGPGLIAWTWLWTGLALLLVLALTLWPYSNTCGFPLVAYFAVTGLTMLVGCWAAVTSWRYRRGFAHVLALLTIVWSATLLAGEILPRIGYAKVERIWLCP